LSILLSKEELLEVIVQSIYQSGWNVIYISNKHPFKLKIFSGEESYLIKIIIYNLSHGCGYKRPHDEYRIQLKVPSIEIEAGYLTLILGYWADVDVFAGFDINKHLGIPGWSASLQIKEENLRNAHINGFSPCDKGNGEIAIAFKPDYFVEYVRNLENLHAVGDSPNEFELLNNIATSEIVVNDQVLETVTPDRRITLATISRKKRDTSFKSRVMSAYDNKCAMCNLQLKLVEAAHILPVTELNSNDYTSNGIALCRLHHRAYDISLVTFNEKYQTLHNETRFKKLKEIGLDGGMDKFLRNLKPIINIPPAINDRPSVQNIRRANKIRGWQ
jgi:putative restriction endonuclease